MRLTLQPWADRAWFKIADRDGNILGRHDGILQRFFPDQDGEYRIDERTSGFPLITDYQWSLQESGLRFAVGSIDKPHLLMQAHVKKAMELGKYFLLRFQYVHEESFEAQRNLLLFTFELQNIGTTGSYGFFTIAPKFFKSGIDAELGGGYRWGPEGAQVELTVAALDLFNNLVFSLARSSDQVVDEEINYSSPPFGLRLMARLPVRALGQRGRIELYGGLTNEYRYTVEFIDAPIENFEQSGTFYYFGALAEWYLLEWLTSGVVLTLEKASEMRSHLNPIAISENFSLDEETSMVRGYLTGRPVSALTVVAVVDYIRRPEVRTLPFNPSANINHQDRELLVSLWVDYLITPKFDVSGELLFDQRTARGLPDINVSGHNQRLSLKVQYHFTTRTSLAAGFNVDLDDPDQARFDGAHLYLISFW